MSAQRAETTEERLPQGEEALAEFRRIQANIRAANPDMTDDDWDRLGDEWADEVNEGLRRHVRRTRGEFDSSTT